MKAKENIVCIIPTYNEVENVPNIIKKTLGALNKINYPYKILFIDDNSPDKTADLIRKFQKRSNKIYLLNGRKNGLGDAMARGYKHAIKNLSADIIISNEADMSYNPALIPLMINKISNGADVVISSRKLTSQKKWSLDRIIIHWLANNFVAGVIAGENKFKDRNSAFRAIRVKVLNKINLNDFPKGFSFFNYMLFRLSEITTKIVEIDATYTPRKFGESKISFNPKYIKGLLKDSIEYIGVCFRIRFEKLFK